MLTRLLCITHRSSCERLGCPGLLLLMLSLIHLPLRNATAVEQPKVYTVEFLIVEMDQPDFHRLVDMHRIEVAREQVTAKQGVKITGDKLSFDHTKNRIVINDNLGDILAAYQVENKEEVARILAGKIGKIVARQAITLADGATGRVRLGSDTLFHYLKQDSDGRFRVEKITVPEGYDVEVVATGDGDNRATLMPTVKTTTIKERLPIEGAPGILAGPPMLWSRSMGTVVKLKAGDLICLGGMIQKGTGESQTEKLSHRALFCRLVLPGEASAPTSGRSTGSTQMVSTGGMQPGTSDATLGYPVALSLSTPTGFQPDVLERVLRSVVKVEAKSSSAATRPGGGGEDAHSGGVSGRGLATGGSVTSSSSVGSGFIVRADGYIATALPVVSNAGEVKVTLSVGRTLAARVCGQDSVTGVAVLKVDATDLPAIKWAEGEVRIGQSVFTFGHPYGMDNTLLTGVVTATKRRLSSFIELHGDPLRVKQFDSRGDLRTEISLRNLRLSVPTPAVPLLQANVPISPGCSGGPVCEATGAVIGMSVARYQQPGSSGSTIIFDHPGNPFNPGLSPLPQPTDTGAPISFAVPVGELRHAVNEIIEIGKVERGWLGVVVQDSKGEGQPGAQGATVVEVTSGSAGDKAGIRAGDVLHRIDDRAVTCSADLVEAVTTRKPGDTIRLTLLRDGTEMKIGVQLTSREEQRSPGTTGEGGSKAAYQPSSSVRRSRMSLNAANLGEALTAVVRMTGHTIIADTESRKGPSQVTAPWYDLTELLKGVANAYGYKVVRREGDLQKSSGYFLMGLAETIEGPYPPRKAEVFMPVGESVEIRLPRLTRVFVNDDKIFSPTVMSAQTIQLRALGVGTTELKIDAGEAGKWEWTMNVVEHEKWGTEVPQQDRDAGSRIQMEVENATVEEVLRLLSTQAGKAIVLSPGAKGKGPITVKVHDVSLKQALEVICGSAGLEYHLDHGVYVVTTRR